MSARAAAATAAGAGSLYRAGAAAAIGLLLGTAAPAQDPPPAAGSRAKRPTSLSQFLSDSGRARWLRPVASLVIPGTGQLLGRSERGMLYLVSETVLLTSAISLQHDGQGQARKYRDLAFEVARRPFAPQRRDTVFDYFEAMGKYLESGPFDTDPGPNLVPPTDPRTFNGHIWRLARETFFPHPDSMPDPDSPAYRRALDFYRRRAVGPNFQWSWRGAGLYQDLFRQSIRASDDALRRARQQMGLILANHLLSAIDALISARRAGRAGGIAPRSHLRLGPPRSGRSPPLEVLIEFRF